MSQEITSKKVWLRKLFFVDYCLCPNIDHILQVQKSTKNNL
jgi:hypothetical protein